jgi:hypothetical protein
MKAHFLRPFLTLPSQLAFRFRLLDSDTWCEGQVEDLSEDRLCFLTDLPLEIGTCLEVALPVAALAQAGIELRSLRARVTDRVLERWPDLRTAVTAEFVAVAAVQIQGAA